MIVPEPYWVTPHAVQRYRERVDRSASWQSAIEAIQGGLQDAAPYPPDRTIAIGNRGGGRFVAIVQPARPPEQEWPQVVTIWGWTICPVLLKRKGKGGKRRYRWLNGPGPAMSK